MIKATARLLRDGAVSIAYPDDCRVCGSSIESWSDGVACARCWEDPTITDLLNSQPLCEKCGAPVSRASPDKGVVLKVGQAPRVLTSTTECVHCVDLSVAAARACGVYTGAIEVSILFLKSHPHIHARLRNLMEQVFMDNRAVLTGDLIVPVPLHRLRLRERGFNQADVVARHLARISGLAVQYHFLDRIKQTRRHRIGMDAKERAKSVKGAFRVQEPDVVQGRSVLLCDDVMTSGSTIGEAATALIKSGATRVSAFTIARAIIRR